jgi:long-chain acyl-CoA synthetase
VSDTVGFWKLAEEDPGRLALVDPSGAEVTYGELYAASNRLVHGLRALGLTAGDGVAAVLPNGSEMVSLYFAAMQAGWYLTPINHHLVGPEIAYIVDDCEAGAFIGHERFGDACRVAAEAFALPADRCFGVGRVAGARPLAELIDGQPDTRPEDRSAGAPMHYTSGTTGRPKGSADGCQAPTPTLRRPRAASCSGSSAPSPTTATCTSAGRRCTTPPCWPSRRPPCTSGTPSS